MLGWVALEYLSEDEPGAVTAKAEDKQAENTTPSELTPYEQSRLAVSGADGSGNIKSQGLITAKDIDCYERLKAKNPYEAELFSQLIMGAAVRYSMQEDKGANADRNYMVLAMIDADKARKRAYEILGETYTSKLDYTFGKGIAAYIGTHYVAGPGNHAGIIIFEGLGTPTMTLGAAEKNVNFIGKLFAETNRGDDINIYNKNGMVYLNITKGQIDSLIANHEYFKKNHNPDPSYPDRETLNYLATPNDLDNYNSNSYARGLLCSVDIFDDGPKGVWLPGWDIREIVPVRYFGRR